MYTTAAFKNCIFKKNMATTSLSNNCRPQYSGTVGVSADNVCDFNVVITFDNCTFAQNQGENVVTYGDYVFSSTNLTIIDEALPCLTDDDPDDSSCSPYDGKEMEDLQPSHCKGFYDESLYDPCEPPHPRNVSRQLTDLPTTYLPLKQKDILNSSSPAYQSIVKVRHSALL
jgi:hypothetical protein